MFQRKFDFLQNEAKFAAFFRDELERKDALGELLFELEAIEKKARRQPGQDRKYEKKYRGGVQVIKKTSTELSFAKMNGNKFAQVKVTPEISAYARVDDVYEGVFGYRAGEWRIISVFCIATELSAETDPNLN